MRPFGFEREEASARHACKKVPENQHKVLVKVRADHNTDGSIRPVAFRTPDGQKVIIDKVLDARQAASLKAGGQGMRYEVCINCGETSRNIYLFDDEGVWFIEKN